MHKNELHFCPFFGDQLNDNKNLLTTLQSVAKILFGRRFDDNFVIGIEKKCINLNIQ